MSWADVPTAILQAEIARRDDAPTKPTCGSGKSTKAYDTPYTSSPSFSSLGLVWQVSNLSPSPAQIQR